MQAKVEHFDVGRRILHIPRPKGGAKRAFDIPLSRQMVLFVRSGTLVGSVTPDLARSRNTLRARPNHRAIPEMAWSR